MHATFKRSSESCNDPFLMMSQEELHDSAISNPPEEEATPPDDDAERVAALEAIADEALPLPVSAGPRDKAEDIALVRQCRSGDPFAWEQLVRQYSRRVYNLAYRFVGRHEQAEDLTQDVFLRIYRSLDQYNSDMGDLSNWLLRLARNLVIDDYRRRQRQPVDSGDDLENHSHYLRSGSENPHRTIERKERSLQIMEAINKLSPDLRQCVIMRDIEELTYQEIVDRLKIPEGTVKSRINRGRIELARVLRRMKVVSID
jgi:RNA polymerase sigma-70 factor (ECF subfamily)